MIRDLRKTLAEAGEDANRESVEMVRGLTGKLVIYPKDDAEGRDIEFHGQLAAILDL